MDSYKTDGMLTIVNRSTKHSISKQLIRKIPYFEKMLSHDLLESKENKVILDFDQKAFKSILNWLELNYIFIEMDYVINMCTIADYFGFNNYLIDDCISHFHDNFSIDHLPVVIPQVTATSKLIDSGALNGFICRYFTKIANTNVWLDYPIETIEYICALDLMIYSEHQVFDAITKWINFKYDSRKDYLKGLLKLIRWCHLEDKDLSKIKENELFKSSDFEQELRSLAEKKCDCKLDRTQQNCFIAIEQLNGTDLRVKVLGSNLLPLVSKLVQQDESMPLDLLHNEHVSDIFFDSGRKMIRIDWKQAKYRLLDYKAYKSYYHKIHKCIFEHQESTAYYSGVSVPSRVSSLLEANDNFILVRNDGNWFNCSKTPTARAIKSDFVDSANKYLATVLDNNIYMIINNFEFFQFNVDKNYEYKKTTIDRLEDFTFDNLLLTSNLANDDKVIIIDKCTNTLFCYNVRTEKWSSIGRISGSRSAGVQKVSDKLITFTSTFISMDIIASELE